MAGSLYNSHTKAPQLTSSERSVLQKVPLFETLKLNIFDDQLLDLWFIFPFSRKYPPPHQRQFYACGRLLVRGPFVTEGLILGISPDVMSHDKAMSGA